MEQRVFIAVGHGGDDPGAVANGFREKDLNLEIAKACRDELIRHGVEVKMDRETDVELSMSETVNLCNTFNPALALDIHNNAGCNTITQVKKPLLMSIAMMAETAQILVKRLIFTLQYPVLLILKQLLILLFIKHL